MKWLPILFLMVLMPIALAQNRPVASSKEQVPLVPFEVILFIHPLSGADYQIPMEASVGQPFFKRLRQSDFQGVPFNSISGNLAAPNKGIYPVKLSFFDASSGGGSIEDYTTVMLRLGESYQRKFTGGVVCYTVTLVSMRSYHQPA